MKIYFSFVKRKKKQKKKKKKNIDTFSCVQKQKPLRFETGFFKDSVLLHMLCFFFLSSIYLPLREKRIWLFTGVFNGCNALKKKKKKEEEQE